MLSQYCDSHAPKPLPILDRRRCEPCEAIYHLRFMVHESLWFTKVYDFRIPLPSLRSRACTECNEVTSSERQVREAIPSIGAWGNSEIRIPNSVHRTIGASLTGVIVQVHRLKPGRRNSLITSRLSASTI